MKLPRRKELLLTGALTVVSAIAGASHRYDCQRISKPLIVGSLQAGLLSRFRHLRPRSGTGLLFAMAAAALGDWFMLRYDEQSLARSGPDPRRFMRLGAASFVVQQVGYSALLAEAGARLRPRVTAPVLAGLLIVSAVDSVGRGRPDPVLAGYGLSLAAMVSLGIDVGGGARTGAALFLLSDSTIIVNGRLPPGSVVRRVGEVFVMLSYAAAQVLLVGAIEDFATNRPSVGA